MGRLYTNTLLCFVLTAFLIRVIIRKYNNILAAGRDLFTPLLSFYNYQRVPRVWISPLHLHFSKLGEAGKINNSSQTPLPAEWHHWTRKVPALAATPWHRRKTRTRLRYHRLLLRTPRGPSACSTITGTLHHRFLHLLRYHRVSPRHQTHPTNLPSRLGFNKTKQASKKS